MNNGDKTALIESLLGRLLARVKAPRVLGWQTEAQGTLTQAIERARVQLLSGPEPVLVVALAGCTGVGKSALTNALAGAVIAEVDDRRPTTTRLRVYHHRQIAAGGLPVEFADEATFVPHERAELRTKVIIDTPDLDSFATQHRALTKRVLQTAGLTLYVFSPEKYLEERTWSVLRQEQRFSASAAVLNKTDQVSPDELEHITADLRQHFADLGLGDIRIFRTCAKAHIPDAHGMLPGSDLKVIDETEALRTFLEHELQSSDVARLRLEQQQRVVAHLRQEMESLAPQAILTQFRDVADTASQLSADTATRFTQQLAAQLLAVEEEFAALATLQQHQRFRGPFRTWLVGVDCLRFGLTKIGRQLVGSSSGSPLIEDLLSRGTVTTVEDLLRDATRSLQDLLYDHGLPVERWRTITAKIDATRLLAEVATELDARFVLQTSQPEQRGQTVVRVASALGTAVPIALIFMGLLISSRDLLTGHYVGFPLLGHLLAMTVFFFVALQGGISLFLPSPRWRGQVIEQQAVQTVIDRTFNRWLAAYGHELEAELTELWEPLEALQASVATLLPEAVTGKVLDEVHVKSQPHQG